MPELGAPNDRTEREGRITGKRFRIDRQPRFAFRRENIVAVKVLVQQNRCCFFARKIVKGGDGGVHEAFFARRCPRRANRVR